MLRLPIRTWVLNAAAVFSGHYGAVTRQAQAAGCSRQTVYHHAGKVERELALRGDDGPDVEALRADNQELRQRVAELGGALQGAVRLDKDKQRQVAVTAFAMGLSLRQIEDLLGLLLPPEEAPDHSTIGRWVEAQAERAGRVLAVTDPACATRTQTLCLDEIFFGGDRSWSAWNRRA
jgi:hypothetical protein